MRRADFSTSVSTFDDEARFAEALRHGDEAAFVTLVERYHPLMVRVAMLYVSSTATAEEVVQETWLGVLRGIAAFDGRLTLKTWIMHILLNQARTRAKRDDRMVPFSVIWPRDPGPDEPAVAPEHFQKSGPDREHWNAAPQDWSVLPEERLLSKETCLLVGQVIKVLPVAQRTVIMLRDSDGWSAADVCNVLGISETNQRVLLHRARAKVRQALESYWSEDT
jgi:RNA polymerase sigma-70 factor (ECF subfamily)